MFTRWRVRGIFKSNIEDGIAYALSKLPNLVLCDLKMADNGHNFAARFRQIKCAKNVMLIAFTDYALEYGQEKSRAAGFDGCIQKSLDADNLYAQIKHFVSVFL